MGSFFKPLRRKVGVVTLSLALIVMVGWVRSLVIEDEMILHTTESINRRRVTLLRYRVISGGGLFGLITEHIGQGPLTEISSKEINKKRNELEKETFHWTANRASAPHYPWFWGDLRRKTFVYGTYQTNWHSGLWKTCTVISYQSVALALTVLSACLLLSKPKHPKRSTEEPARS